MTDDEAAVAVVEMLHRLLEDEERQRVSSEEGKAQLSANLSGLMKSSEEITKRFATSNRSQVEHMDAMAPLYKAGMDRAEENRNRIAEAYAARERAYGRVLATLEVR